VRNTLKGVFDKQLIESVNFTDSDLSISEQQLFLKLWVHAVFFGSVQPTKIILLLLDELNAIVRYMREHPEPVQVSLCAEFRLMVTASI
jgi:hypothetical protein